MEIKFYKYQGTGNDFVILDNRSGDYDMLSSKLIRKLCDRRFGIGADGLMLMNNKAGYDFEMIYFNSDGKAGSMCGNGGRCIVQFARDMGISQTLYSFMATDGAHEAEIDENNIVRIKMQDVNAVEDGKGYFILNTGSPHFIKFTTDVRNIDVVKKGKEIRYNDVFKKDGTNVNFVENINADSIYMRTYERGVEDETFSCGTGVTAAALVSAHNDKGFNAVNVQTNGGWLSVEFTKINAHTFTDIYLCGPAKFVFAGTVNSDVFSEEKKDAC